MIVRSRTISTGAMNTVDIRNPKMMMFAARLRPAVRPLEDAIADDAPEEVAARCRARKTPDAKQRRAAQFQVVAVRGNTDGIQARKNQSVQP